MDVSSVSSSISNALAASLQQSASRNRPPEQDLVAQFSQPAQQTQGAQRGEQAERVAAVDKGQESARVQAEPIRSTVNANGQTVGTMINTTA